MWPGGIKALARTLAVADIANVSELAGLSDYQVFAAEGSNPLAMGGRNTAASPR